MKNIIVNIVTGIFLSVTPEKIFAATAVSKPNIILIFADDIGLGDVHVTGGPYKTPQIDALAASGLRFEYSYAAPLCEPSRGMLLTGRYSFRTGLIGNSNPDLPKKTEVMFPPMMKAAGYVTACIGKWSRLSFDAGQWGFDEYMTTRASGRYWSHQISPSEENNGYTLNGVKKDIQPGEYLPDLMHNYITSFLEKHKDQPFLLYYPMEHAHVPILPTPDSKPGTNNQAELYADNIMYMDKLVGKLLAELERLKLRENTVILFTGDNGTASNFANLSTVGGKQISGQKGSMLDGGSRVPLIVNWPGVTPVGKVSKDLTDITDFFSTLADLGGAKLPEGVLLDSRSFAPQIKGEKGIPRDWVYTQLEDKSYVRNARYKLTNGGELFDMIDAPFAERLLPKTPENKDVRAQLQKVLDDLPLGPITAMEKKGGVFSTDEFITFFSSVNGRSIQYSTHETGPVTILVSNVNGKIIARWQDHSIAGKMNHTGHTIIRNLTSGIYLLELTQNGRRISRNVAIPFP